MEKYQLRIDTDSQHVEEYSQKQECSESPTPTIVYGKVPKWLTCTTYTLSDRTQLKIDELDGDGTVLDTVRKRPSQKFKVYKQVQKKLAEMEEFIEFINNKKIKGTPRE